MPSIIERFAYRFSAKSRSQKWAQFERLIAPLPQETIVDVGVNIVEYSEGDNYLEKHLAHPERITAVAIENDFGEFPRRYPRVKTVSADGRSLPFETNAFDIAYSNAVIEHVGGPQDQTEFLRELFRVSRRGYLTTPNRFFPIEVHTRVPLLHLLLPKSLFDRFLTRIGKGWAAGDYMHLLSENDLRTLLTECHITNYTLEKNRLFGLTMTFTLVWHK